MPTDRPTLIVEGWLHYPQSHAIVAGYHLLDLAGRAGLELRFRELPPPPPAMLRLGKPWVRGNIWTPEQTARLGAITPAPPGAAADATLRIAWPYDFLPAGDGRTFVFVATESGQLPSYMMAGGTSLGAALYTGGADIVTPSAWSRYGLMQSGAAQARVHVVPHGVDTTIFRPLPEPARTALRARLGWSDDFVLLNVSAQYEWKGTAVLLRAFAGLAAEHPRVRLALKGTDQVYGSRRAVARGGRSLTAAERGRLAGTVQYLGHSLGPTRLAELYQAADVLVAPYHAEGFNLPVLEAIACGLAVICTAGGPTDDFMSAEVGWRIPSRRGPGPREGDQWLYPDPEALLALLHDMHRNVDFRHAARAAGPALVERGHNWTRATDRLLEVLLSTGDI